MAHGRVSVENVAYRHSVWRVTALAEELLEPSLRCERLAFGISGGPRTRTPRIAVPGRRRARVTPDPHDSSLPNRDRSRWASRQETGRQ